MAINKEDKADVKRHYGKAIANKISKVTKDKHNRGVDIKAQKASMNNVSPDLKKRFAKMDRETGQHTIGSKKFMHDGKEGSITTRSFKTQADADAYRNKRAKESKYKSMRSNGMTKEQMDKAQKGDLGGFMRTYMN